jgi:thiazole synthase ThiGH ThiG subunit
MADLLTFSVRRIRNEHEAQAIVKNLRYHKCDRILPNKDHITSCVDAIGQVLEQEFTKIEDKNEVH